MLVCKLFNVVPKLLTADIEKELSGTNIDPDATVKPLVNVCNAVHTFAVDRDAPPDGNPLIQKHLYYYLEM